VGLGLPGTHFGSGCTTLSIEQRPLKLGVAGSAGGHPNNLLTLTQARPVRRLALGV
jgi:hypothetical protein